MFEESKQTNTGALDFNDQNTNDNIPLLDKEPTMEDSITKKQQMTMGQIIWKVLRNGIPTAIALADYNLVLVMCYFLAKGSMTNE